MTAPRERGRRQNGGRIREGEERLHVDLASSSQKDRQLVDDLFASELNA